jgi:nickel superoxide dismutase
MTSPKGARGYLDRLLDLVVPPRAVYAHCDIPCGIYDPHDAQLAALSVLRMDQLLKELPKIGPNSTPEERETYGSKLARITIVKEAHCERLKNDVRIIWGDYFTPDHVKQHPTLHETVFKIMKQVSKARQGTNTADAEELLKNVQEFAEIFWKTKNVPTKRLPSNQKSGGEIVYPVGGA